jgi:hypothetical protein
VNACHNCTVLKELACMKCSVMQKVIFLHENAGPHTACVTMELLEEFHWEYLTHSSFSLDLAPSDCYLFGSLKKNFDGKCF